MKTKADNNRMVCSDCWPTGFELKTKGGLSGQCAVCERECIPTSGPATVSQITGLRNLANAAFQRGRIVGFAEGMRSR